MSAKTDGSITKTISANTAYTFDLPTNGKDYTIAWVIPAGLTAATFTYKASALGSETYEAVVDDSDIQITMDVTAPVALNIVSTICILYN